MPLLRSTARSPARGERRRRAVRPLTRPVPHPSEHVLNPSAVRTQPRFPAEVAAALKHAGWHPGRWQIRQAEEWADILAGHGDPEAIPHAVFPAAVEAWAEFGGLSFDLDGPGRAMARTPFLLDPRCALHQPRTLADLGRALGTRVAPLGEEAFGQAQLVIDEEGRVYSLDHAGEWYLGRSIDHAVTTLVLGLEPERLRTVAE